MQIAFGTYVGIALQAAFGLIAPAVLYLIFRKRWGCARRPFWTGCLVMLAFALVLEQAVHTLVLSSAIGTRIQTNPVWMALYGGAMAALFEEGGRFLAMHYLKAKGENDPHNALMYGAGHGGFETFFVLVMAAVSNLACIAAVRSGAATDPAVISSAAMLASTPFSTFLLGILERCAALCAQISMSVVMWFGVRGRARLVALAFLMHFALDAVSMLLQTVLPVAVLEILICAFTALYALLACSVWRKYDAE